jgi:metal-dependent amidase/aminoacylase/carboxypeptidase family protein
LSAEDPPHPVTLAFMAERVPTAYIYVGARPVNVARDQAADHHPRDLYIDDGGFGLGLRALTAMALHYMGGI